MGDRILIQFDQEIECSTNCVAYLMQDARVTVLNLYVCGALFVSCIGLHD